MSMMLPGSFFDLSLCGHPELFRTDEPVWTVLDRLHDYIDSLFQGSWPLAGHAGMVESPLVIANGELRHDLTIHSPGSGKSIRAFDGDDPLEDAAIVMPGAYLFDDRIIIGAGSVVEPGALIKGPVVIGARTEVRQGAYMRGDCLAGDDWLQLGWFNRRDRL